jgi:hypothetical protein
MLRHWGKKILVVKIDEIKINKVEDFQIIMQEKCLKRQRAVYWFSA